MLRQGTGVGPGQAGPGRAISGTAWPSDTWTRRKERFPVPEAHTEHLQRSLRALVAGSDPARLLNDTLRGAVQACGGRQGLLVGLVDGVSTPLASTGPVPRLVVDVADAAIASGRLSRRTERGGKAGAVGECLRVGDRVVGALAVGGNPANLD